MKSYTYDNNGNILTTADSNGTTIRTYDEFNRVLTKTVSNICTNLYEYNFIDGIDIASSMISLRERYTFRSFKIWLSKSNDSRISLMHICVVMAVCKSAPCFSRAKFRIISFCAAIHPKRKPGQRIFENVPVKITWPFLSIDSKEGSSSPS